jgi:hypothetical protein
MKRIGLVLGVVAMALGAALPGRTAAADEWSDPARVAVEAFLARAEAASAGREATSWVTKRLDEVAVFADLARVDVSLEVTNGDGVGTTGRPLEWRRALSVDPRAELIGAVYTRADGMQTTSQILTALDARRLYGTATTVRHRDPLWVTRERPETLEVTIFPVPPQATVRVVLSFVTPLYGRGAQLEYRDPLSVRVRRAPAPVTPGDAVPAPEGQSPLPLPAGTPPEIRAAVARATRTVATPAPAAHLAAAAVHVSFQGVLPAAPPEGATWAPREDGTWRIEPAPGADVPPLHVRSVAGAAAARTFLAQGYPIATSAFAWRADPAALLASLGVDAEAATAVHLEAVSGSTSRIAPEVLAADEEPTVVMGRAYRSGDVRMRVVAVGADGARLARRELVVPCDRSRPGEAVGDALRAYHRARLADRVARWAGADAKRQERALAYAVDMGVLRKGTAALAIPEDERGWLTKDDLRLYLTDGMPFDGDSPQGDFISPPPGSVR